MEPAGDRQANQRWQVVERAAARGGWEPSQERLPRRLLTTLVRDGAGEIVDEKCVRHLRFLSV
jgi:hypothetical protein